MDDELERIKQAIADDFDEELEMQLEDDRLDELVAEGLGPSAGDSIDRKVYFRELFRLQHELVKLQDWVAYKKLKVVVLFEGRDSAGKGGLTSRRLPHAGREHAAHDHVVHVARRNPSAGKCRFDRCATQDGPLDRGQTALEITDRSPRQPNDNHRILRHSRLILSRNPLRGGR